MNQFPRLFYRLSKIIKSLFKPINESPTFYQKSSQKGGGAIVLNGNTNSPVKMTCYTIFLFVACCLIISYCNIPVLPLTDPDSLPFRNTSLPLHLRVNDLVNRLTLEEIQEQSQALYGRATPAIRRLAIKPYIWITECLHGQVGANSTSYPQSLGLSSSFSRDLLFNMSTAVSTEVRAQWNNKVQHNQYVTSFGLNCFSPVVNIMRHPLWGRNQETYGEDPYLSGELAKNFIRGLRGQDKRYVKVGTTCKHFDAHGGPENIPSSRFSFDAKVAMRDWRMTFLPQFRACNDAGTDGYMCSYNSINGVPACANEFLLKDITRKEWKFKGYIISDSGAIVNIRTYHNYTKTDVETVATAIKAGTNIELTGPPAVYSNMLKAIQTGLLTEQEVRENVKILMKFRFQIGEFDPPANIPYNKLGMEQVQKLEHRQLSLKAAQMSFVLLKNRNNFLPLKTRLKKVTVVGPMANNSNQMFGDYGSMNVEKFTTTPYQAFLKIAENIFYEPGCLDKDMTKCTRYNRTSVIQSVKKGDIIFLCLGTGPVLESESNDRRSLNLPGKQLDLLKDVVEQSNGKPIVLLLFNAGPLDISYAEKENRILAILECFFPGQTTGEAIIRTLMMKDGHVSVPAARLTATWYKSLNQIPPITDYTMKERTYRYFTQEPLYPFGYGLSYSTFHYTEMSWPEAIKGGETLRGQVVVTNTGNYEADEVVQVYISWNTTENRPKIQLVQFERVTIPRGISYNVKFAINPRSLALWMDDKTKFLIPKGKITLFVGGQQPGQKKNVGSNILQTEVLIETSAHIAP